MLALPVLQAGARPVSQPPAPTDKALPVMYDNLIEAASFLRRELGTIIARITIGSARIARREHGIGLE